jgi:SAM-dependent methyltransferase
MTETPEEPLTTDSRGALISVDDSANTDAALTERQRRERAYYDEYARRTAPGTLSFAPVLGRERRPWNPYWFVAELVRNARTTGQQTLLDFGCGPGNYGVLFAKLGYRVFGFDISPVNVEAARRLAEKYELGDRTQFAQGVAERLEYPDAFFDVVVGIDILHHVDIRAAMAETVRVLKPGGVAIFKEPVEAPVFDRLRNTRFGRWVAPKEVSFDRHITEDERKLTREDLRTIRGVVPELTVHPFRVLSRLDALAGDRLQWKGASLLEMVDAKLLRVVPGSGRVAGTVVLEIRH